MMAYSSCARFLRIVSFLFLEKKKKKKKTLYFFRISILVLFSFVRLQSTYDLLSSAAYFFCCH